MGNSEKEYSEKISKIKLNSSEKVTDTLDIFGKMQKLKSEYLKRTEEMMTNATNEFEKLERDMSKNKDLSTESRNRLNEEIGIARSQVRVKYDDLKTRMSQQI